MTQVEAAQRVGTNQPKVSALLRGDFSNLSERKPMACLNRLGSAKLSLLGIDHHQNRTIVSTSVSPNLRCSRELKKRNRQTKTLYTLQATHEC
ncbi:XRE family transcriptional regulator [Acidithiobacillus sp.]|uniref:XRE family transcriptional regulator n=1 Tax=Acidithiobacillus sp. TaxID=1872118 RepID=UPI00345B373D